MRRGTSCLMLALLLAGMFFLEGCGYHTSGGANRLPDNIHTIYVPMFVNATQTVRVEQVMTAAVVQEFRSRTNFRVVTSDDDGTADATLKGTVNYTANTPLTFDSVTGRISS